MKFFIQNKKLLDMRFECVKQLNVTSFLALLNTRHYSKNQKTKRSKAPTEGGKSSSEWVSKKRTTFVEDDSQDKLYAERKIVDSVWLMNEYKQQELPIETAIKYHMELAQPRILNNMDGFLHVRMLLDMKSKKKGKFLDNIKGSVYLPHYFKDGIQKEVIAICKNNNEIDESKKAGALLAGFTDILQKFEKGEISEQMYDFLVCTPDAYPDVVLLKKKINKDKFPTVKGKTVTENIVETVRRLHLSKDYESMKNSDAEAILKMKVGRLNFEMDHLVENLKNILLQVLEHKKFDSESFIKSCVLYCPPSTEKFKIDVSRFYEKPEEKKVESAKEEVKEEVKEQDE
jgi:ribosomal protein L1